MKKFVMNSLGAIREIEEDEEEMTLRDYFAAKAMQADIGNVGKYKGMDYSDIAKRAYEMANVMMEARKK